MLTHVVSMKFKSGVAEADIDDLEKSLDELPNSIVEIQMYDPLVTVGIPELWRVLDDIIAYRDDQV